MKTDLMKTDLIQRLKTFFFSHKLAFSSAIVSLITVIVYLPSLNNGFVNWDDQVYVYDNWHITSLDFNFLKWAFSNIDAGIWHPLTWISHAVDYSLWGLNPHGHHLFSIVLHGLNTLLVVILVARLLQFTELRIEALPKKVSLSGDLKLAAAIITGLLFGLHPLHVESVAWVSERKDVLCAFFFLLSLLAYTDYARDQKADSVRQVLLNKSYITSLVFFVLALMSKPMAITLPAVLLILDWHPFERLKAKIEIIPILLEKVPFLLVSLSTVIVTFRAQEHANALLSSAKVSVLAKSLVSSHSLITYLWKMIWPHRLMPYYPYPRIVSVVSREYLVSPFLVIIITASCFLARKQKIWMAAWGYYVVTILPVLGIVQVGMQEMADRYSYLPSLGPFLLFGIGAAKAYDKIMSLQGKTNAAKISSVFMGSVLVIIFSTITVKQIHIWKNGITLWTSVIRGHLGINLQDRQAPARPFIARAMAFEEQGRFAEALNDYRKALQFSESDRLHASCGLMYIKLGKLKDALHEYDLAIRLNPKAYPDTYYNRGNVNVWLGRLKEGIMDYTRAIKSSARAHIEYYNNRGLTYESLGMHKESEEDLFKADMLEKQWTEFKWPHFVRNPLVASAGN